MQDRLVNYNGAEKESEQQNLPVSPNAPLSQIFLFVSKR